MARSRVIQRFLTTLPMVVCGVGVAAADPPVLVDDRYRLELVASEPEIVTPVGMAFDQVGRLLIVESHTHQRQADYDGPPGDRILALDDSDGDGRLDRWSTFAEGFRHALNLLVRDDGAVYLVTRGSVVLLRDTDADGRADEQRELVRLETEVDYPHNALSGIAQSPDGGLILGLGENFGYPYRLVGSDGKAFVGTGGFDGVFSATADGAELKHIARGVWNLFSLCVDPHGRIFAVDNDPDASPPCRLLHIVQGGDYGYLFQYGRAGTHPLQAWNGELPGTLPMVCGTGEAPTAIVAHAGRLWVTSWGDHRIESYRLVPRGASYGAEREVIVQGEADFRPTGMAVAPDGSLYFGDWVKRDYPVHKRGRIWRLVLPANDLDASFPPRSAEELALSRDAGLLVDLTASTDPFVRSHAVMKLTRHDRRDPVITITPGMRLALLCAMRLRGNEFVENPELLLRAALEDESADVRLYAVRWIADERIVELRDDVAALVDAPMPSERYYLAVLAAIEWLDSEPKLRSRGIADSLLARELRNKRRRPEQHALALTLIAPDHQYLTIDRLRQYLESNHAPLRLEAVRTLALQTNQERFAPLGDVARDAARSHSERVEAVAGLAAAASEHRDFLETLADGPAGALQREAVRVLRLAKLRDVPRETKPAADNQAEWNRLLASGGDAEAGRRLFFSAVGARCAVCHRHSGRGGYVGPDLTHIGRASTREKIIASILQPSREIAPEYQPWQLITDDGKSHLGLRLHEGGDNGTEEYLDSEGNQFVLRSETIELREASRVSIMPDGLEKTVSLADLRDLLAFLTSSAGSP